LSGEHLFGYATAVKPWELEQLRRSVVMLPPGHSAGALSREQALKLFEEIGTLDQRTKRYEEVLAELRRLLASLDLVGHE
jgi:hypothetical protein